MSESTTTAVAAPKTERAARLNKAAAKVAKHTNGDLTGNEAKILKALAKGQTLTREQLSAKTGIAKGWSKTLGSSTKDDGGMSGKNSLTGRGLVKCTVAEGVRALQYTITAKGKAAVAKV